MAATEKEIRETFRKHFAETKQSAEAHNRTVDELAGKFHPDMPEAAVEERRRVSELLWGITDEIELEMGDPFQVAVHEAVESLKRDDVAAKARDYWKEILAEATKIPKGPKEWTPRREELEEEAAEGIEGPYLYVLFDDRGGLEGWTIDFPDYFRGHGGPVAAVPVSASVDYGDIESEIAETLSQADIDWGAAGGGD